MIRPALAALVLLGTSLLLTATSATAADAATKSPAILVEEFINEHASYPECHASTIAEVTPGKFVAAWFGGTKERNPDVGIWVSRQEGGHWLPDVEVANGIQPDGKPRLPTWNPVLFQPPGGGPLLLFYKVGPSPGGWWGMMMASRDGGKTWEKPHRLPDKILGPVKDKPIVLPDGSWLAPSSTEDSGARVHFELTRDGGQTWKITEPQKGQASGEKFNAIQPTVLSYRDGRLQALCRTNNGMLVDTWSSDQGQSWSPLAATKLPNPASGVDAVTLADGRQLLVYNHSAPTPDSPKKGKRYPLNVALSDDGKEWKMVLTLESEPRGNGYAYPAVIQAANGDVHITYTWDRKHIKHVVLDPKKL